ncbi:MAG: AAA family ATPase [Betaproteobacteria bacterium]|nr:AAA family ATPase [Betaproteobacteria bacterium]
MTSPDRQQPADAAAPPLIAALMRPECYAHRVREIRMLETHISWVFLTGDFAYKIKKPLNLGFLNFSTLEARRYYCEKELVLNRRLAKEMYLDVVSIRGTPAAPQLDGRGPVFEYAVKMREFPQRALAAGMLARGEFGALEIDALAAVVSRFHQDAAAAGADARHGTPALVLAQAIQNFEQIAPRLDAPADVAALNALRLWTEHNYVEHQEDFAARRQEGFVRECHGDLHLGNIAVIHGRPVAFDCIEFNEDLRWIDVMSEVAFLVMDLEDRRRGDLAWRFLNRYLESTGDYAGLAVLRFYLVYRALVRAKVHALRACQAGAGTAESDRLWGAFREYLKLATGFTRPERPVLVITHGLCGSGKTTATLELAGLLGAVRLRSDLERKRMHGLAPLAASRSGVAQGIYTRDADAETYRQLASLAHGALDAGCSVLVDATFLKRRERRRFRSLAADRRLPFLILDFAAPETLLRERVSRRRARGEDASEADLAVLTRQLTVREPLTAEEQAGAVVVDGTCQATRETWEPVIERLRAAAGATEQPVASPAWADVVTDRD